MSMTLKLHLIGKLATEVCSRKKKKIVFIMNLTRNIFCLRVKLIAHFICQYYINNEIKIKRFFVQSVFFDVFEESTASAWIVCDFSRQTQLQTPHIQHINKSVHRGLRYAHKYTFHSAKCDQIKTSWFNTV